MQSRQYSPVEYEARRMRPTGHGGMALSDAGSATPCPEQPRPEAARPGIPGLGCATRSTTALVHRAGPRVPDGPGLAAMRVY